LCENRSPKIRRADQDLCVGDPDAGISILMGREHIDTD